MLELYQDGLFRKYLKPILNEAGEIIGWVIKTPVVPEVKIEDKTSQEERLTLQLMLEASHKKLKSATRG